MDVTSNPDYGMGAWDAFNIGTPAYGKERLLSYGEGSVHYWRHRVKEVRERVIADRRQLDPELLRAFVDFSVAHLHYSILADEYHSAHQMTGQPWPDGFDREAFCRAQSEMEATAMRFVHMVEGPAQSLNDNLREAKQQAAEGVVVFPPRV